MHETSGIERHPRNLAIGGLAHMVPPRARGGGRVGDLGSAVQQNGASVGRYRILAPLGQGGMADVHLARMRGPRSRARSRRTWSCAATTRTRAPSPGSSIYISRPSAPPSGRSYRRRCAPVTRRGRPGGRRRRASKSGAPCRSPRWRGCRRGRACRPGRDRSRRSRAQSPKRLPPRRRRSLASLGLLAFAVLMAGVARGVPGLSPHVPEASTVISATPATTAPAEEEAAMPAAEVNLVLGAELQPPQRPSPPPRR